MKRWILAGALLTVLMGCLPEKSAEEPRAEALAQKPEKEEIVMILMKTSMGDIKLELYPEAAPKTVANFLGYVESGYYSGTIFHRVINGFMIQGGGFTKNMQQKIADQKVENEAKNGLKNVTGTIAMARTADPHSASCQFFINVADNASLDYPNPDGWGYCVFGKVVEGMEVVNAIKSVPTGMDMVMGRFPKDVPQTPIVIEEVTVIENEDPGA